MRFLWVFLFLAASSSAFASTSWMGGTNNRCEQVNPGHTCYRFSQTQACGAGYCRYQDGSICSYAVGTSHESLIDAWGSSVGCCTAPMVVNPETSSCECPAGKIQQDGSCIDPPTCPEGQVPDPLNPAACTCPDKPNDQQTGVCFDPPVDPQDCIDKGNECAGFCNGRFENIAYFYCETATAEDPTTQLFHTPTYSCRCGDYVGCPEGQQKVINPTDGSTSCAPSSTNPYGCPAGSFYGEFNQYTGCISTPSHSDPDEAPLNCTEGSRGVYYGSTLYCVPKPDLGTCATGTEPFITDTGLKICKGTDLQGNPTGDSPDTNGSIKGTPTGGNGSGGDGGGDGGDGSGTGTDNAAIAAKLDQIKSNTDTMKASVAQTAANTQATANNTAAIKDAVTGPASTTAQGSFAESTTAIQAEVETLKTEYGATIADVKGQMTTFLSDLNTPTGTGGLPCYPSITIPVLNIPFALCFTQFEEALSIIGTYIYGIAFLFAGLIILGSTRGEG